MQEKDLHGNRETEMIRPVMPISLIQRLHRIADRCGVDRQEFIRIMIVELAEEEKRRLEGGETPVRKTNLNITLPAETADFITRQAKKKRLYRSQYLQELLLGSADPEEYFELGNGGQVNLRFTLPAHQAEKVGKLAHAAHLSRSQYIRDAVLGTPVNVPVYLNIDMDELEPLFRAMEDAAAGIQDLVLRPDRTEEEKQESRRIQTQLLEEIRRIRLQIEEWGVTTIASAQALLHQWPAVRDDAGLSDLSA